MEQWPSMLISAVTAAMISVITSVITLKITQKNEVRKHILEERTKFYLNLFPFIDTLVNSPHYIFNQKYMDQFFSYRSKVKLLASPKTFSKYQALFDFILEPYNIYDVYDSRHSPADNQQIDPETLSKIPPADFDLSREDFCQKYLPDRDELINRIEALYLAMRSDLGSNMK